MGARGWSLRGPAAGVLGAALLAAALPQARPAAAPAMPPTLDYDIVRRGEVIGHQHITFRSEADKTLMHSQIDIKVSMLLVTLFHYEQTRDETWAGDRLVSLTAKTDDDGQKCDLRVSATASGFEASSGKESWAIPSGAIPLSYWHISMVSGAGPLFDSACGKVMSAKVVKVGDETVPARRDQVTATHYRIEDPARQRDVWYDANQVLVRTSVVGKDGSAAIWILK